MSRYAIPAKKRRCIPIGEVRADRVGNASRVSAEVAGREVWFESSELDLSPVAEAFGSAFLIPALFREAVLDFDAPVDPVWIEHLPAIHALLSEWWQTPALMPRALPAPRGGVPRGGESVLFFSGGADSFFTLLCSGVSVNRLLLVQGFDYCLDDADRHAAVERTLREVADACGLSWAVVRTNARVHPLFEDVSWEQAHGGVLAGVAHTFDDSVGSAVVSSSVPEVTPIPWGSHWLLDPLWSSSRRAIRHVGQEHRKEDKLRAIAREPLAHRHLRVCWANRSATGNCSRCYKCLYARLVLAEMGALDDFETFEGVETLAAGFDGLPRGKGKMLTFRSLMDSPRLPADVKRALQDVVARTMQAPPPAPPRRSWRAWAGRALRWPRMGRA